MSVTSLMTQPAILMHLTGEDRGPTGQVDPTYTEEAIVGYFEPEAPIGLEGENLQEGNFELGRWFGAVPAGTDLTGHDVILYGEFTLELTGPPREMWNPRLQSISHIELSLRSVEITEPVSS